MQGLEGVLGVLRAGYAIGAGRSSSINPKLGWRFGGRLLADCSRTRCRRKGPEAAKAVVRYAIPTSLTVAHSPKADFEPTLA